MQIVDLHGQHDQKTSPGCEDNCCVAGAPASLPWPLDPSCTF